MTNPLASADFFALEAGECLDRLESEVDREQAPPADEFLRNARVLRGSALMAGQHAIARAAAGLEALARAHRDQPRDWDAALRAHLVQAVEEFRLLIRRVRDWTEADSARASRLALGLESLAGRAEAEEQQHHAERGELNTGVRAFVAREGALIASALDRAARSLRSAPGDREPLYTVIRRMQSLRGLAELGELVPLPEILDGIELAVGDLTRLFAPPPGVDEVMGAASQALTRMSRDIAERGRPDPEAPEARRFTDLLLRAFAVERDVVPIESLFFAGDPEPVTPPLAQPQFAAPAPLGPLELVSHGEHLCQSADLIANARSATERDLRLYHLLGVLRSAGSPGPDPVASGLAVFARSAREALAVGVAASATAALVGCLREGGELLRAVADADDRMLISRRILDVAYRLDGLRLAEQPPQAATTLAATPAPRARPHAETALSPRGATGLINGETDVVSIDSLLYDEEPVSILSLAPDEASDDVIPIAALAPDPPEWGLEASFRTYDRLRREAAGSPASEPAIAPVPDLQTVEIAALCYRGRAALERAGLVRQQLADELTRHGGLDAIQPLLQELLDLVPLALAEA
ncbi:MAG TPA: hypothetical protein VHR41_18315 [Gemmatimonadales bacterium]|jgi:hypothetical protein|nr:hypothetical protein [Gemmatimonadales bacterium]